MFFCKRGSQKHNRAGFYWGVPSETSNGYDWTAPFLSEYELRRKSDVGKDMMGMIFRTDTLEYLSSKEVNAWTMNTVAKVIENPEPVTIHSWRKMLRALALHLKFSQEERHALGDRRNATGDEAPITLSYAKGKEGMSKVCKLVCAAAFSN